ncbi:hypothetical protein J6590_017698 [Homalodisca vitripennis]|nr:hypothetical protein J6590_017698 [Homalodisca vitripennis]
MGRYFQESGPTVLPPPSLLLLILLTLPRTTLHSIPATFFLLAVGYYIVVASVPGSHISRSCGQQCQGISLQGELCMPGTRLNTPVSRLVCWRLCLRHHMGDAVHSIGTDHLTL